MRYNILIKGRNPFRSMRYNNLISRKGFLPANEALIPHQQKESLSADEVIDEGQQGLKLRLMSRLTMEL
jgi:hypothetical protein